jgi:hypothetical protein
MVTSRGHGRWLDSSGRGRRLDLHQPWRERLARGFQPRGVLRSREEVVGDEGDAADEVLRH